MRLAKGDPALCNQALLIGSCDSILTASFFSCSWLQESGGHHPLLGTGNSAFGHEGG